MKDKTIRLSHEEIAALLNITSDEQTRQSIIRLEPGHSIFNTTIGFRFRIHRKMTLKERILSWLR